MLDPFYTLLSKCWPSFRELINYWLILALRDSEKITNEVRKIMKLSTHMRTEIEIMWIPDNLIVKISAFK